MFKTLFIRELVYKEHCQGIKFTVCIFLGCPSLEGRGGWRGEKWSEMNSYESFLGFHSPLLLQNLRLPVKHFSNHLFMVSAGAMSLAFSYGFF